MSSFNITLDSADPTWDRSDSGGAGSHPYETVDVYISSPLCYAITGTGGTHRDAYLYVYNQGDFDVTDPNAPVGSNLVMKDDDDGDGLLPAMSGMLGDPSLTPGMYTIVVTSFSSADDRKYGSLDFSIFGANVGGAPGAAPPAFAASSASKTVNENSSGHVFCAYASGSPLTYSLVGGADQSLFSITASGALSFQNSPDFETPGSADNDNVYEVIVRASDGTTDDDQTVQLTVANVNEAPTFTSASSTTIEENSIGPIYNASVTDPDANSTATFSIDTGSADAAEFSITANGALSFQNSPDYESPSDANGDNFYDIRIQVSDGSNTVYQSLQIEVTDVNETDVNEQANQDVEGGGGGFVMALMAFFTLGPVFEFAAWGWGDGA